MCQGAAECANFFSIIICIKLQHLANAIINAGFVMIQSARVGVGRFAEGMRAIYGLSRHLKMTFEQQMRFMSTILISYVILLMSMLRHIYRYSSMVVSYTAVW